ncbi:hypothetical protein [Campylobacter fetus]|uniref:hypothetical protein n=1 Tax=Campylobacter fetus TaxID=196 RepID=UPI0013D8D97C|nr:hypothetical protein [Campylobacter fetus]
MKNRTINPKEIKFSTSQPPLASTNPTLELASKFAPKTLIAFSINVPRLKLNTQPTPTKAYQNTNIKVPMFAKFGPKIPPIIPPATTKTVALFLSFCVVKFRASLAKIYKID